MSSKALRSAGSTPWQRVYSRKLKGSKLDAEDMDALRALDQGESLFFSHYDPEFVEFMAEFGHRVM